MPRFAQFRYGSQDYGQITSTVTRSSILAQAINYQIVTVTILAPTRTGQSYILLRGKTGAAEDPSDGLIVSSGVIVGGVLSFTDGVDNLTDVTTDNDVPIPSGIVYYTLFVVDNNGSWTKDAATSVIVPKDRGTIEFFRNGLPGFYTSEEHNPLDPSSDTSDLMRFLYGFSMTYDELSEHIDNVLPENRGRVNIRRLHDTYARSVGMPTEYTIGVATTARLYRESGFIYRNKGTTTGIATYTEALTGWQTIVSESTNKLLSIDDGSFEYSTGNWGITGGTLTNVYAVGPTFTYEESNAQFSRLGVGQATLTSTSAVLSLPGDGLRLKMIPVSSGTVYYVKVPMKKTTGTPTVTPSVQWYTQQGVSISTSALTGVTAGTAWSTVSGTVTAPTGAAFAKLIVTITGTSGNVALLDMLSFSESNGPYRDPRSVTVICQPNRINLLFDPSIDYSPTAWSAVTGTFTVSATHTLLGAQAGKGVGSPFEFAGNVIPVLPHYAYSLSAYAYSSGGTCEARLKWYDVDDVLVRTDVANFSTLSSTWTRLDYSTVSPDDADHVVMSFAGTGTVYVDATTLEISDRPQVFFSGGIADAYGQDSSWSDGTPQSYSLLYANRFVKIARLRQTIKYYLPVGVTARVLLWDSQDPEVQSLVPNGQ